MKLMVPTLLAIFFFIPGCTEQEVQPSPYEDYIVTFMNVVDDSNKLLNQYHKHLDSLYTQKIDQTGFGKQVSELVPQSNELVQSLDNQIYNLSPPIYNFHRELIGLINRQHLLLVNSVDAAFQDKEANKELFSNEFQEIKQEHTVLIEQLRMITTGTLEE
ncbi:hypothetical protein M3202_15240 [Alkalihalobacillus oceani]|uniref:Uncharacterized protein n=1 Tax=Halalkalibacter oceani TaxID=1653776 RepID=A0A9X2DSM1_9BACI|nr:hypothetical protein [Halalkalibacter oceani]MCM3715425.1 hypothetical protein [Halalkalibacter oceani]